MAKILSQEEVDALLKSHVKGDKPLSAPPPEKPSAKSKKAGRRKK